MMMTVLPRKILLLLLFTLFSWRVKCQDILTGHDLIRLHQLAIHTPIGESTFNTHAQNEPQITSENQFNTYDRNEQNHEQTARIARVDNRRKIFHIKDPFRIDQGSDERKQRETSDIDISASNQYASMQYSLPPEGFLNKIRGDNHAMEQFSTPTASGENYLTTQQSQYSFPSNSFGDSNKQFSSQYESSGYSSPMRNFDNNYASIPEMPNFSSDSYQAPLPSFNFNAMSTPAPSSQYLTATPSPSYMSTPAPPAQSFVSTPAPYVSSPLTQFFSSPNSLIRDLENRMKQASTSSPSFDSGRSQSQMMQIDHFNHANSGMRNPYSSYQHENPTTTPSNPTSTALTELRDAWRNTLSSNYNQMKTTFETIPNFSGQNRERNNKENNDMHRATSNNSPAANTMFLNYAPPNYDFLSTLRTHTRDLDDELSQPDLYSHGDYGWKMTGKRALLGPELYDFNQSPTKPIALPVQSTHYPEASMYKQPVNTFSDYFSETQKPSSSSIYGSGAKSQTYFSDDFMKAASKLQEEMKYQSSKPTQPSYYGHEFSNSYAPNYQASPSANVISTYFGNQDKTNHMKDVKFSAESSTINPYSYGYGQELSNSMPTYFSSSYKDTNTETKFKQPFDHAKALKNIVPIDVSNVLQSETSQKSPTPSFMKYTQLGSNKDSLDQTFKNLMEQYKPISDQYFKDKNGGYGINIKKPENSYSSFDTSRYASPYFSSAPSKTTFPESLSGLEYSVDSKRFSEPRYPTYVPQATNLYMQQISPLGTHSMSTRQQQQDSNGMLKLSDLPYNLSPTALSSISDSSRLHSLSGIEQNAFAQAVSGQINQNLASHQLDTDKDILNKLYSSMSTQSIPSDMTYSTYNGIRFVNPFNVDMKLVHNAFSKKPEDPRFSFKDQYSRTYTSASPSSRQISAKSEGSDLGETILLESSTNSKDNKPYDVLATLRAKFREADPDTLQAITDMINPKHTVNNHFKYSRSQDEEIGILPAAEASDNYPIGAVVDAEDGITLQEDTETSPKATSELDDQKTKSSSTKNTTEEPAKKPQKHPNSIIAGRPLFVRKYPRDSFKEPYPLLKPPPRPLSNIRLHGGLIRGERARRRRVNRMKFSRVLPLFSDNAPHRQIEEEKEDLNDEADLK